MELGKTLGAMTLVIAMAAVAIPSASAQNAAIVRDLTTQPADARIRHSGHQGGRNSPEWFGREMAQGDFNNDGKTDLAVSADFDTARGDTSPGRGFVYVYFGRGELLPSEIDDAEQAADCRIYGEKFFGQFGTELAVGDFDGDGFDDLAVSQIESYTINWGNVFLVSGADMATNAELRMDDGQFITQVLGRRNAAENGTNLHFGFALTAGDFNGDGIDDVAAAALGGDGVDGRRRESGDVSVILGRRGTWPREMVGELAGVDLFIVGRSAYVRMGTELVAGDLDGDGRAELAVATYGSNGPDNLRSFAGDVTIYSFGASSPVTLPPSGSNTPARILWDTANVPASAIVHGPINGARIGTSASDGGGRQMAVGDYDGDGIGDLVLGSPFYGPPSPNAKNPGALFVVWGGTELTGRSVIDLKTPGDAATHLATGEPGVSLGDSVRLADLNGDGRDDVVAGAPDWAEARGYVALIGGRPRPEVPASAPLVAHPDAVVMGPTPLWRFGESVTALDASFGGVAVIGIGTPQGGFFPFGGRGYAGEIDAVLTAPLTAAFPKFPSIAVSGEPVVAPGASVSLQVEVAAGEGAVALSAPDLPAFASLHPVDATAGLYLLTLTPTVADRGRREVLLVATDSGGNETTRRLEVAVGFTPYITNAKLKKLTGQNYKLTIDGSSFSAGDAVVVIDGQTIGGVKYPSKFSENGGATVRRLTAKSAIISIVVEPGQTSFLRIVNPREGLVSAPFAISR